MVNKKTLFLFINNIKIDLLLFFSTLIIYIHNLSSSVYGGDSGDFITSAFTKGVPHPSGYPLATLLSIISIILPIYKSPAWKVGLTSSILSSLCIVFVYLISIKLTKNKFLSLITSFTMAFIYTFWIYAEVAEIFPLHNLLILILLYMTLSYFLDNKNKYLYFLSFFIGLSLTNNLSIILIFPVIFIVIITSNWKVIKNIKLVITCFLLICISLSVYLYIPIAASANPVINWGNARNLPNFINLVFRRDYGWGTSTSFKLDVFLIDIKIYYLYIVHYLSLPVILIISLGIIQLLRTKKIKLLLITLSFYILLGPFYVIFSRMDFSNFGGIAILERFYLASFMPIIIYFPFGLFFIMDLINKSPIRVVLKKKLLIIAQIVIIIIPLSLFINNFKNTNLSDVNIGNNLAYDILKPLPNNTILLVADDSMAFNILYVQYVLNYRKDVIVPGNYSGLRTIQKYVPDSYKIIDNQAYQRNKMDAKLMYSLIPQLLKDGVSIYSDSPFRIQDDKYGDVTTVPYGILYRLEFDKIQMDTNSEEYKTELLKILSSYHTDEFVNNSALVNENLIFAHIRRLYVNAYVIASEFVDMRYKDLNTSVSLFKKAKELDPTYLQQI